MFDPPTPFDCDDGVGDGPDPTPCAILDELLVGPFPCVPADGLEVAVAEPFACEPLVEVFCDLLLFLDPTTPPTTAAMIMATSATTKMMIHFLLA